MLPFQPHKKDPPDLTLLLRVVEETPVFLEREPCGELPCVPSVTLNVLWYLRFRDVLLQRNQFGFFDLAVPKHLTWLPSVDWQALSAVPSVERLDVF